VPNYEYFILFPNIKCIVRISFSSQGGILGKIRRRLTVQGDSETIDGGALAASAIRDKLIKEQAEDVRVIHSHHCIYSEFDV
jgi:hypothetical protein